MKCSKCKKTIFCESPDEDPFLVQGEVVCRACWCEALGEEIEKHPIMDFTSEKIPSKKEE
jgi:hypothetical protein